MKKLMAVLMVGLVLGVWSSTVQATITLRVYPTSSTTANLVVEGDVNSTTGSFSGGSGTRAARIALMNGIYNAPGNLYCSVGTPGPWTGAPGAYSTIQTSNGGVHNVGLNAWCGLFFTTYGEDKIVFGVTVNPVPGSTTISGGIYGVKLPNGYTWGPGGQSGVLRFAQDNGGRAMNITGTWIIDNKPPIAICRDVTVTASGTDCTAPASIDNGSYDPDSCDGSVASVVQDPPGPYPVGTTAVTLIVTDKAGATATCAGTVTVLDEFPTAKAKDISVTLQAGGTATINAADVDDGSTDNCSISSMTVSPDTVSCADVGTPVTVELAVTDSSGNKSTATATVTVLDQTPSVCNQPPTASAGPDVTVEATGAAGADVTLDGSASVDPDGDPLAYTWMEGATVLATHNDPVKTATVPLALGVHTITLTVDDGKGGTSTATFKVTVVSQQQLKAGTLEMLADLKAGLSKKEAKKIDYAIKKINQSLEAKLWESGSTLTKYGNKVFDMEHAAVKHLKYVEGAEDVIAMLVHVDESLALIAIAEAQATAGADAKKIAYALKEMDKAADEIAKALDSTNLKKANDHYAKAIQHYKHAWKKAMEAVKKASA